ncbi:protease complex subunit PrcB family protein [Caldimonas tepidiphila]|uniref:protease complex subunit PrcB family protein n=1 Tax=Caldimonas tepidiphila TaxID=2315841 RepID=UPI000E5AE653|nr:protease complex subunit PrcB family protein [Caldimonas tepidiphila]
MHRLLALPLAAALLAACGGGSEGTRVPFVTIVHTQHSQVPSREELVLRGNAELNELWGRISVDGAPLPSIDFSTTQIVGVFLGTRPNGCHHVSISRITRTTERLVVRYRETVPGPGDICTQALVTPAHLVALARTTLPVEFAAE